MSNPEEVSYTPPLADHQWEDPTVINLNDQNFNDQLKEHNVLLVMFYAPWCSHCKKMKPEYLAAAKDLSASGYSKCLAMVDCTVNPEVTEQFNIEGFPTIKLFKNGKYVKDYTGKRTVEEIKRFVMHNLNDKKDEL